MQSDKLAVPAKSVMHCPSLHRLKGRAMKRKSNYLAFALVFALVATWAGRGFAESATQLGLPDNMNVIVGDEKSQSPAETATQNVLALDLAMFGIYDDSFAKYQKSFMAQHPIIMALFTNEADNLLSIALARRRRKGRRFRSSIKSINQSRTPRWLFSS